MSWIYDRPPTKDEVGTHEQVNARERTGDVVKRYGGNIRGWWDGPYDNGIVAWEMPEPEMPNEIIAWPEDDECDVDRSWSDARHYMRNGTRYIRADLAEPETTTVTVNGNTDMNQYRQCNYCGGQWTNARYPNCPWCGKPIRIVEKPS